ncbi:MAG: DNA topoisomerase VI subunit B [Candidatus Aenigmatarchaeota archaeon]
MAEKLERTAEDQAKDMKEISPAEFFEKNRHFLGYENPVKSLLTVVKEAIDNSLEFTCDAGILPEIFLSLKQVGEDKYKIIVKDNGPGVVEEQVPKAFGKVLYGSRFHKLKQSRSLFGIGIKGVCLYSQLTTGKPIKITTGIGKGPIHVFELMIDVTKNEPHVISHKTLKNPEKWHGTILEFEVEGKYIEKGKSIPEFLKQTSIANPYAHIVFDGPNGKIDYPAVVKELPKNPKEIKPHPYGVEIGILRRMSRISKAKNVLSFLKNDFSRVGSTSALEILKLAKIDKNKKPFELNHEELERLHKAMQSVKLIAPPTDCLSPLGENLIIEGLKKEIEAEYFTAISRPPAVYRGVPFEIEVGLAYGGKLDPNSQAQLLRFANKVPLMYHQSDCAITQAVEEVDWRRYGLQQPSNSLPIGPLVIFVHFISVWVPFTTEGKQAIASYPDIIKEIKLALQDAGRKLKIYISRRRRHHELQMRQSLFEKYIPEVAIALSKVSEVPKEKIKSELEKLLKKGVKEGIEDIEDHVELKNLESEENGENIKEES